MTGCIEYQQRDRHMLRKFMLFSVVLLLSQLVFAQNQAKDSKITLKPNYPYTYVVKKNDNIWRVASQFLVKPWQWSRIWDVKDGEGNAEELYPGDVLRLDMVKGQPKLVLAQAATVKLSPKVRSTPIRSAIPVIPSSMIRPFLNASIVIDSPEL